MDDLINGQAASLAVGLSTWAEYRISKLPMEKTMTIEVKDVMDILSKLATGAEKEISDPTFRFGYVYALNCVVDEIVKLGYMKGEMKNHE